MWQEEGGGGGVWQLARRGEEDGRQMEEDKEDKEVDGGGRSSKEEPEQGEGQEGGMHPIAVSAETREQLRRRPRQPRSQTACARRGMAVER